MLPSDLNKLVEFLDNHVYYDKEHLGKLLYLMEDDSTRSHLLVSIMKLSKITSDVRKLCADIDKARNLMGFEPKMEFGEGIRETLDWYKANNTI